MEARGKNNSHINGVLNNEGNLTQIVYRKIKEMMTKYEIIPGQRLVFNDLAKRLGVSRTPVNNALSVLANEGFLDLIPHQGYTVHKITKEEAESLYEIREMLEIGSVRKTIKTWTNEKIDELERKKSLYEKAVVDQVSRGRFVLDQEFHAYVVAMSENLYIADYFREVYGRIFLRHRIEGLLAERAPKVVSEHNEIFDAIKLKDIEWAKEAIKLHIKNGKKYIYSIIFD